MIYAIYLIILCICEFGLCFLDIDEFRELKYGIEIRRKPVIFSHLPKDNIVHLSSKYGQMYQCNLPVREKEDPNSEDDLEHQANLTVKAILDDALANQCLIYNLGWWTYKVCYKKEVTQYHEDNGIPQGAVINLGSFESEKDWNDTDYKKKRYKEEYHTHNYINGSSCELVGKERQTTVKFVCSDESSNLIMSVDEPETCTYTITIGCKDLCVHPLFKPKKKESVKEIICSPAISKDQYEQYLNQEQENLLKKKKAEEEAAKLQNLPKKNKVEVLMSSLDGFASGFTSFITNNLVSSGDESEDSNQKQSQEDLSNFWKDFGYNPEGPDDSSSLTSKREMHKTRSGKTSDVVKEDPKVESETNEIPSDNAMSKGDNMLSTEGQYISRDPKTEDQSTSKINENLKRLISLQSTINKINKQAAALIKKDQDKRRIFMKTFFRSKRKVEKQIGEFKKLMSDLKLKKSKEIDKYNKDRLDKLIRRVNGNIQKYKKKLSLLEAQVKKTLQKSKAFEKSYRDLLQSFPIRHTSKKTDIPETKIKSLNEVIRELRTEKQSKDESRIVKSGNQLASEEESGKNTQDHDQDQSKKLDPLLETLMSMLKLSNKMKDSNSNKASKEEDGSGNAMKMNTENASENSEEEAVTSVKSSEEHVKENEDSFDGKVKVRIRRLNSEDTKVIEENEKQEELSGISNADNRLKTAGKKIEDMIKMKLKKAGVDIGANIKIKIITNEGPLSSMPSNSKTEFLTDETATQFKDILANMLGGGAEKVKEQKRQAELEDSYRFVWNQDENTDKERTDYQDNDKDPFIDADL